MGDFGDLDDFNEHEVQGRPIKAYKNGCFDNPKSMFVQLHWSWDDFLCACSQRLEMVPMASRVFNSDGVEIDDLMCIEEGDMLFFSTGAPFKVPGNEESADNSDVGGGVVGGYRVTTLLGRGGFGEVRLGVHQLTNEKVALKFILKNEMGSLGDVERTTTEIQCLTALNHPSIIKLIRVFNEPNHVVLVFELLEGGDLFHHLAHLPPGAGGLTEEEGAIVFSQILSGVGYAHNQHICHRDLKLENILLQSKNDLNSVKIADFGLSDFYRPGAMAKTTCGSISYLPPEVFRGTSNAGPPLDVWSLGVILFAIVCGRLPFEGSDLKGSNRPRENVIRNRIMRAQYKLDDHLTPEVTDLIQRMLKLDPIERATIPEIFSHPWIRAKAGTSGLDSMSFSSSPIKDGTDDGDCESFTLTKPTTATMDDDKAKQGGRATAAVPLVPPLTNLGTQSPPSTVVSHPPNTTKRSVRHDIQKATHKPSPRNGSSTPTSTTTGSGPIVPPISTANRHGSDKQVEKANSSPTHKRGSKADTPTSPMLTPKESKDKGRRPVQHTAEGERLSAVQVEERLASVKSKRRPSITNGTTAKESTWDHPPPIN
ncbi:Aste57867_9197 [Aphanomyces stellatus]|uniref:Aste57867_9197 protein n=1 Tax=Aphanomyces stellatus TaxID=120398 RepID=A0A485KMH0_9STRA|nr:hypothetical protein As57867_009161 [Aphanomyces stellatus]VFT86080.1 Aste57867_9197 [Aphanomyces stellatus]